MNLSIYLYIAQCSFKCKYKHLICMQAHQTYNLYSPAHMCLCIFVLARMVGNAPKSVVSSPTTSASTPLPSRSPNLYCISVRLTWRCWVTGAQESCKRRTVGVQSFPFPSRLLLSAQGVSYSGK